MPLLLPAHGAPPMLHVQDSLERRQRSESIVSFSSSIASSTKAEHPASVYSNDQDNDDGSDNFSYDHSTVTSIDVQRSTTPDFQDDYELPFFALTLYDFESDDADHMSFRKNEIIEVVAIEPSGWWAARRIPSDAVGWVPGEFVGFIPPEILKRLESLPPEVREHDYNALVHAMSTMNFDGEGEYDSLDEAMSKVGGDNESFVTDDYSDLVSPGVFPRDVTPFTSRFPPNLPSVSSPTPFSGGNSYATQWPPPQQYTYRRDPLPQPPRTPVAPRVPAPAPQRQNLPYRTLPSPPNPVPNPAANPAPAATTRPPAPLRVNIQPLTINKNKPTPPTPSATTPPPLTSVYTSSSTSLASSILPRSRSVGSPAISSLSSMKILRPSRPQAGSSSSIETPNSSATSSRLTRPFDNDPYVTSPNDSHNATYDSGEIEELENDDFTMEMVSVSLSGRPSRKFSRNGSLSIGTPDKIGRILGDEKAQAFANAKRAQASLPWYLRPLHPEPEIKLDHDGGIRAGTLPALVERLTVEALRAEHEARFRSTFLKTFHAFTTAEEVFELLVERYQMDAPANMAESQFDEWKTKKAMPTRSRVLFTLKVWVEQFGLVQDDPQIIPRLREFLQIVVTPPPHQATAQSILTELQRRRTPSPPLQSAPLPTFPPPRKASKRGRSELLKLEPAEIARQLTLYEARLYLKVRPHECMTWANAPRGEGVKNLKAFVSTNDKLAAWVKMSVLGNDALGRRSDTIDMWVKVAEKCRALNNFASMSAIVAALTSQVISRLQLTWAHVHRASHMDPLIRLVQPVDNFGALRSALGAIDGPCLPYIGVYLSDMVRVSEPIDSYVTVPITDPDLVGAMGGARELKLINFFKYQRMAEVMESILKHQRKVPNFNIVEIPSTMQFVEAQLELAASKDEGGFWMRSQEVQHAELAHADIRKGLEAAGF